MITLTLNTLGLIAAAVTALTCVAISADNHLGEGIIWALVSVVLTLAAYVFGCGVSAVI